jgi:hypothetical protein
MARAFIKWERYDTIQSNTHPRLCNSVFSVIVLSPIFIVMLSVILWRLENCSDFLIVSLISYQDFIQTESLHFSWYKLRRNHDLNQGTLTGQYSLPKQSGPSSEHLSILFCHFETDFKLSTKMSKRCPDMSESSYLHESISFILSDVSLVCNIRLGWKWLRRNHYYTWESITVVKSIIIWTKSFLTILL